MDESKKFENLDGENDEKVDRIEEEIQRKAKKNANPLAPPINDRAT